MQENVKAFDKAKADKQRKAYIGSLIMIFVLIVCIILAIFAWFKLRQSATAYLSTNALFAADDLNVQYNTYAGTMLSNGSVEYDMSVNWNRSFDAEGESIPKVLTYPGERRYFMTVVSNNETRAITGNLYFKDMLVNSRFITTSVGAESVNFSSRLDSTSTWQNFDLVNNSTVVIGDVYSRIPLQPICENVTLPAATISDGDVEPTPLIIYWYVTLNGAKVRNDIIPTTTEEVGGQTVTTAHDAEFIQFSEIKFLEH